MKIRHIKRYINVSAGIFQVQIFFGNILFPLASALAESGFMSLVYNLQQLVVCSGLAARWSSTEVYTWGAAVIEIGRNSEGTK